MQKIQKYILGLGILIGLISVFVSTTANVFAAGEGDYKTITATLIVEDYKPCNWS